MESSGNLRIHFDKKILLLGQVFVALTDLILDPGSEGLSSHGIDDVDEPLTWDLVHIPVFRKVRGDFGVLPGLFQDPNNVEVLILGTVEVLDGITFDAAAVLGK